MFPFSIKDVDQWLSLFVCMHYFQLISTSGVMFRHSSNTVAMSTQCKFGRQYCHTYCSLGLTINHYYWFSYCCIMWEDNTIHIYSGIISGRVLDGEDISVFSNVPELLDFIP